MKYLFILFIFVFFLVKTNGQNVPYCTYRSVGEDYNLKIDVLGSRTQFFSFTPEHSVKFSNCELPVECGDVENTTVCAWAQAVPTDDFSLGNTNNGTFNYSKDGLTITYISEKTKGDKHCEKYTTKKTYKCLTGTANYNVTSSYDLDKCEIKFTFLSPRICQTCPDCSKIHKTSCDITSGWCTCDGNTKGLNCNQLNANISSVLTPTISGGDVIMSGDFSNIYNISSSITISIGTSICNNVIFSSNKSQIKCTIGAGKGDQQIKLSDGNGATLIYDGFYYRVPCSIQCSPFGKCNDHVGNCICNDDVAIGTDCKTLNFKLDSVTPTFVTGGQVYLNGNFSNVKDLSLTIKIGDLECSDVKFNDTNFKILQCTIREGEGIKDIIISSGLLSFSKADAFEYQYYKCPLDCSTPNGTCNIKTGICTCYNEHFGNGCEFTRCPLDCSTPNGTCDVNIGICTCNNEHFGNSCEFTRCPLDCSTPNGTCDVNTGNCACNNEHFGNSCEFTRCPLDCSTPNGTCNNNTGNCTCNNEHFGNGCEFTQCPLDCSTPNGTCDVNTGICTCNNEHIGNGCEIRFIECKHKCSTKHGMCDNDIGNCKCDTQTKGLTCEESRLLIESSDSTNSKGGTINIIGYFGNTTSLLTIKIGESQCKNIKVFNETTLKCDIGEGKGIHNITIIDDDLSFTAINKFQYLDEKTKISKISRGAIAGIVVGCVVAVSLIDLYAITIENVFTKEECEELIRLSEEKGYEPALVNTGNGQQELMTDVRNNDRCIIDTEELSNKIYERIKEFIPQDFRGHKVVSLNERLRFLRYYPGQEFKAHFDGSYERTEGPKTGERSHITCQLYLNDVEKGGETTFFVGPNQEEIKVNPSTGMIILFQHRILHQGSPVVSGVKYVIRTDVMYNS
ncbi:hypothetical protein ACTFIR_001230 [Dictyostelium discoideum]